MSLTLFTLLKLFQWSAPHSSQRVSAPLPGQRLTPDEQATADKTAATQDPIKRQRAEPSTLSLHKARPLTAFQVQAMEGAMGKPMHQRTLVRPAHRRLPSLVMGNSTTTQSIVLAPSAQNKPQPKSLRVSRLMPLNPACDPAQRWVMSGSMNEVCAELDRRVRLGLQA